MLGSKIQRWARLTAVGLVGLSALSACGGGGDDEKADSKKDKQEETGGPTRQGGGAAATTTTPPTGSARSYVASAAVPEVNVFADEGGATPLATFANPWENGTPLVFLIDGNQVAGEFLPVYVPAKPNGSKGFVRATDVTVAPNPYWVRIEQGAHHIVVTKNDEVIVDDQVGLGDASADWDTPNGLFFIKELIDSTNPAYGPYAYGLSAFTENESLLEQFPDGVVGLHGTNEPDSIGKSVSHGCIRVRNDVITELAEVLPLGTPVEIVA